MSAEPIIVLIFIRYLKGTLKKFSPNKEWDILLRYSTYAVIALLALDAVFDLKNYTFWIWTIVELILILLTFKLEIFAAARKMMLGLVPIMALLFVDKLISLALPSFYNSTKSYFDFAKVIAFTWLIAMIVLSNRERKVLEAEKQKRLIEEEKHKIIEKQKDHLESLVAERTSEITRQKEELEHALVELQATQKQLIQSEKMASLGELTAGIAHEIQNPLNFVNNFSEVSVELLAEMKDELKAGNNQLVFEIVNDIEKNLVKITHHGKRADSIVKGMLQHSRTSTGSKEPADINALADEYLRLSYHGLRAKDKNFNAIMNTDYDENIGLIQIIPQDIGRVFLNLYTNAFYAVYYKKKKMIDTGEKYDPTVWVETKLLTKTGENGEDIVSIRVKDNGPGIPKELIEKIYQPFFTTKPSGEGTGLGLSLSYDIIYHGHNGKITVDTKEGEYAAFEIDLPVYRAINNSIDHK